MDPLPPFTKLASKLVKHYSDNSLLSILAYGSQLTHQEVVDEYSDFDITLVFHSYPTIPLPDIPAYFDISIVIWQDIEDHGPNNFYLNGHGPFYLFTLASAKNLYGTNPFDQVLSQTDPIIVNESLKNHILNHCSKLHHKLLQTPPERLQREILKYSFRIAQNTYFLHTTINYQLFLYKNYKEWVTVFSKCPIFHNFPMQYLQSLLSKPEAVSMKQVFDYIYYIKNAVKKTTEKR